MRVVKRTPQTSVTLPKDILDKVEKQAEREIRKPAALIAKIVIDYYEDVEGDG